VGEAKTLFFTKAKRAQNINDYESWISGGVAPTLNAMDNNGEAFATVLIIDGTRVDDVRVYEDGIVPTVISRYGTGGGNVPMVFEQETVTYNIFGGNPRPDRPEGGFYVNETEQTKTLDSSSGLNPSANQGGTAIVNDSSVVRRLTPVECERLQGFPDNWTDGQADSNRYKQMGNAVAVPVVEWIISRMVGNDE
jgi:site-specific DNA-cytosine methylase